MPGETIINDKNRFLLILRGGLIILLYFKNKFPEKNFCKISESIIGQYFSVEDWSLQLSMIQDIAQNRFIDYPKLISQNKKNFSNMLKLPLTKLLPELQELQNNQKSFSNENKNSTEILEEDSELENETTEFTELNKSPSSSNSNWIILQYVDDYGVEQLESDINAYIENIQEQKKKLREIEREKLQK